MVITQRCILARAYYVRSDICSYYTNRLNCIDILK